jgi:hypothetical protein
LVTIATSGYNDSCKCCDDQGYALHLSTSHEEIYYGARLIVSGACS